jgi:hypothetical protein
VSSYKKYCGGATQANLLVEEQAVHSKEREIICNEEAKHTIICTDSEVRNYEA